MKVLFKLQIAKQGKIVLYLDEIKGDWIACVGVQIPDFLQKEGIMKKEKRIEKILNSGKDGDGMAEISIEIDSLTNCLVLNRTGEEFDTEYKELRKTIGSLEAKSLQKEGWLFDWAKPYQAPGMQVY